MGALSKILYTPIVVGVKENISGCEIWRKTEDRRPEACGTQSLYTFIYPSVVICFYPLVVFVRFASVARCCSVLLLYVMYCCEQVT